MSSLPGRVRALTPDCVNQIKSLKNVSLWTMIILIIAVAFMLIVVIYGYTGSNNSGSSGSGGTNTSPDPDPNQNTGSGGSSGSNNNTKVMSSLSVASSILTALGLVGSIWMFTIVPKASRSCLEITS